MKKQSNAYLIWGVIAILLLAGIAWQNKKDTKDISSSDQALRPATSITHAHGLAVDVADSNKLHIATHQGLLTLHNDTDLYHVGISQDDFMGFSPSPTDPNILFSSGHPQGGGNLGVQKSEDGGFNWKKISNGVNGPVDFHTMQISSANSDLMYGWYRGALQRSDDGGYNWEIATRALPQIIQLATHPKNEDVVYAATSEGLLVSQDKGVQWSSASQDLQGGAVTAMAVTSHDPVRMFSFSDRLGLARSDDEGKTWEKIDEVFSGETVFFIAVDKQQSNVVYVLTQSNAIYKSTDSGSSWSEVR